MCILNTGMSSITAFMLNGLIVCLRFIFGWERGKTESKILNFILLYTKYYIYCTRCNQQSLFLEVFKRKLLFMYKTHMEIAINNNDLTKFEKEWSQFLPLVNSIDA